MGIASCVVRSAGGGLVFLAVAVVKVVSAPNENNQTSRTLYHASDSSEA